MTIIRNPRELAEAITRGQPNTITKEELATIAIVLMDYSDAKTGYEEKSARLTRLARVLPPQMQRLKELANQSHISEDDRGKLDEIFQAVNDALYPTVGVARITGVQR